MAITYTEPTFDSAHPGPALNEAEETRIRVARDAQHQAVATAATSLVTEVNANGPSAAEKATLPNITTAAGKAFADEAGAVAGTAGKATATMTSNETNVNVKATGKITVGATGPADNSTIEVASKVYTFKTALTETPGVEGEVLIGVSAAVALDNLKSAVNGTAGGGTTYWAAAAHTLVTAEANEDTTQLFQAKLAGTVGNAYNLVVSSDPASDLTVSAATFGTGTGATLGVDDTVTIGTKVYKFVGVIGTTEGNVLCGASAAASLDNLKEAVNSTGVTATQYCAAIHPDVEATTNTNTTQVFLARTAGSAGNLVALATSSATLSFNGGTAFLRGGYQASGARINANAGPVILDSISVSAVSSAASITGLTAGSWYKYFVLTPVTATYGSAVSGTGTGTTLMALTASADLLLMVFPIA